MDFADASRAAPNGSPAHAASSEKWLALDGVPAARWRLADETNLDRLEAQIKAAMRSGDPITVEIRTDTGSTTSRLVLNGRSLPYFVLFETSL